MPLTCPECDALWEAYDRALKAHLLAVDTFTAGGRVDAMTKAREALFDAQAKIQSHGEKHIVRGLKIAEAGSPSSS
jgi:hypothetical protein